MHHDHRGQSPHDEETKAEQQQRSAVELPRSLEQFCAQGHRNLNCILRHAAGRARGVQLGSATSWIPEHQGIAQRVGELVDPMVDGIRRDEAPRLRIVDPRAEHHEFAQRLTPCEMGAISARPQRLVHPEG